MRFAQSRYLKPQPAMTKKQVSVTAHMQPPIKGMSLQNKGTPGDPQTATILKNFVLEDDRIEVRSGHIKLLNVGAAPVWHLVPHYGTGRLLAASNKQLTDIFTPVMVQGGFNSDDWHWTSFSNLGESDYTVMVNGQDGVWSWDGFTVTDPAAVAVTKITDSALGSVTVTVANITPFKNGQTVTIAGVPAGTVGIVNANGSHVINAVNIAAKTFVMPFVDTSSATADYTTAGVVTANPPGSIQKEKIAVPDDAKWINPDQFNIVLSHMNRLWFADSANLAVYYLPLQQKGTEKFLATDVDRLRYIPLNVLFKRGGTIRALATWTLDGGTGMEDHLVIFSTNGEVVIYNGTDPNSDFTLVGIFRFDSPLSKHSVINYGGDCWAFVSTGMIPLSTMLRAESEQLGQVDRSVISTFLKDVIRNRGLPGFQAFLNPSTQRLFCNLPLGAGKYKQMVRHMPRPVWSEWADLPARCWGWIDPFVYFGDDHGNVYEMHPTHQTDNGNAIVCDAQFAWTQLKTPNIKQVKMVKVHVLTDGLPLPFVDCRVDYETSAAVNRPELSGSSEGSEWNLSAWNTSLWAGGAVTINNWTGVACKTGYTVAMRVTCNVLNCTFGIAGIDVKYEVGDGL